MACEDSYLFQVKQNCFIGGIVLYFNTVEKSNKTLSWNTVFTLTIQMDRVDLIRYCRSGSILFAIDPFIMKTPIFKYIEHFTSKKAEIFQIRNPDIFHISAQNIDCGYSLEPPRRGNSNEYPQSTFLSINKKK